MSHAKEELTVSTVLDRAKVYIDDSEQLKFIEQAYLFAKEKHTGQFRKTGEDYIIHPLNVAMILTTIYADYQTIAAGFLHDVLEDCDCTADEMKEKFGEEVTKLVQGVTKLSKIHFSTENEYLIDYYKKIIVGMSEDVRVIIIKLADRLHNMRTLDYKNEAKRREKSAETLRIFVPLATHVGATIVRNELADLSFKYLSNSSYREISGMSKDYVIKHQATIEDMLAILTNLAANLEIDSEIRPRVMNNFAIYQNLITTKKISLLPNFLSYHIMVDKKEDIAILAQKIMQEFNVIPEYTEDFITHPLSNGYQALHLSIRGHKKTPFQIRLFTKEMFLVNNYGFSALLKLYPHKSIKEIQEELIQSNEFFHSLDQNYKLYKKPFELIDKSVRDLLADKINVYVANGALYCLPAISTVADLADKIHTKLRKEATGAIVNGVEVDLNFPLKNNDHVIILTKEKENNFQNVPPTLTRKKEEKFQ